MSDIKYEAFASPNFDANDYANAILAGEPFPPSASLTSGTLPSGSKISKAPSLLSNLSDPSKGDISVAISKLTLGLDDVSKQIKAVVTTNHEALLAQASGVSTLEDSLRTARNGLDELVSSQDKLRAKIHDPCATLAEHAARLSRLQLAADALRRTSRFVVLSRRLEVQMKELSDATGDEKSTKSADGTKTLSSSLSRGKKSDEGTSNQDSESEKERTIAKAALTVAELTALLDTPQKDNSLNGLSGSSSGKPDNEEDQAESEGEEEVPLRAIRAVAAYIPAIESAREKITSEMETMVLNGLATLNQSLLASSLQTAHNLRVLPGLVQSLVADLTDAVEQRIRIAFDLSRVAKDVGSKEPASASPGLLYKSRVRTEPTNVTAPQWTAALWTRLESLVEEMADCCVKVYTLEKVLTLKKDILTQMNFMDEAMKVLESKPSTSFWSVLARTLEKQCKDAARGSTFMQQTLTTGYPRLLRLFHDFFARIAVHTDTTYSHDNQSPETILIVRALANLESLYLSRSAIRVNEVVAQAFAGGARAPPAMGEGLGIARAITNELEAAKFDPLLVINVARNVQGSLELLLTRADPLIVRDRWAISLLGPVSTPQQAQNAQVATCLFHCWSRLDKLNEDYPTNVIHIVEGPIKDLYVTYERIVDPLLSAIKKELDSIVSRMHKQELGKQADAGAGPSTYMKDLVDKLDFIKIEVLGKFNVGDASRDWFSSIVRSVLKAFILHVSITKPLTESVKLQLTTDMTELEFSLSAFMVNGSQQAKRGVNLDVVGDDYRRLRALRPLLFLENSMLASPESTAGLPSLIVLHHILVRSPIPLPHTLHGWQESEYVRWLEEHSEEEALSLVEGTVAHWEKIHETSSQEYKSSEEYLKLARSVLDNARRIS